MRWHLPIFAAILAGAALGQGKPALPEWHRDKDWERLSLYRKGAKKPLVVVQSKEGRPFLHPLSAPDGVGELTEYAPGHHKHQTGLFVGFLKVNGRDFFHQRGKEYFKVVLRAHGTTYWNMRGKVAPYPSFRGRWYLLDKDGSALLKEDQLWLFDDRGDHYVIELVWTGTAEKDVTFGKHDYGGLFLRMPWKAKTGGKATNSEGDENAKAEGKRARWVDVGMPIEGRKDWGRIAILDHKDNFSHPTPWRVDGQLGVGPAPSRAGEWKIDKGKSVTLRYRIVVYTGDLKKELIEKAYKEFVGQKK